MNSNHKNKGLLLIVVFLLILFLTAIVFLSGWIFYDFFLRQWDAEKNLPKTAQDVHVKTYESFNPLQPDVIYTLKARITEEEFEAYCKTMGFIESPDDIRKFFFWHIVSAKRWWDPTGDVESSYYDPTFRVSSDDFKIMKYENGYLYFMHCDL